MTSRSWCQVRRNSFPLVGPCKIRKEGSQRLEGLSLVIAGSANHVCIQG